MLKIGESYPRRFARFYEEGKRCFQDLAPSTRHGSPTDVGKEHCGGSTASAILRNFLHH